MKYRNCGYTTVTCYGVEFKPGEIKEVPGVVNHRNFIEVFDSKPIGNKSKEKPSPKDSTVKKSSKVEEPNIEAKAEKPVVEKDSTVEKEGE